METLHWVDYVVFVLFMFVSLGIGVYHAFRGGRQRSPEEFLVGNRQLSVFPTMVSMLVTHQSAIMILGYSAEMYNYGAQMWVWGMVSFAVALVITERVCVPWLYPLKCTSVLEYFELRFGSPYARRFAAPLCLLAILLYNGAAIYAPSVALETATGISVNILIPLVALVCTAYTFLGGIKAVIWTDVFQSIIMIGGMVTILIVGCIHIGGFGRAMEVFRDQGRLNVLELDPDPRLRNSLWTILIGYTTYWVFNFGLQQGSVQRYGSVRSLKASRMVVLAQIVPLLLMVSLACMTGVVVTAYFALNRCDPLASKQVNSPNQLLISLVMKLMGNAHGFKGLFLSTLYSGALSTVSSNLSSSAAIIWEDIFKPCVPNISDHKAAWCNKAIVVVFGLLTIGLGFLSSVMPGPMTQISTVLLSAANGPVFGMFLLAGLSSRINWVGAVTGALVAFIINSWKIMGSMSLVGYPPTLPPLPVDGCGQPDVILTSHWANNETSPWNMTLMSSWNVTSSSDSPIKLEGLENFYGLSYLYLSPMGVIVTCLVAIPVSLLVECCGWKHKAPPSNTLINFRTIFSCDSNKVSLEHQQMALITDKPSKEQSHGDVKDQNVKVTGHQTSPRDKLLENL